MGDSAVCTTLKYTLGRRLLPHGWKVLSVVCFATRSVPDDTRVTTFALVVRLLVVDTCVLLISQGGTIILDEGKIALFLHGTLSCGGEKVNIEAGIDKEGNSLLLDHRLGTTDINVHLVCPSNELRKGFILLKAAKANGVHGRGWSDDFGGPRFA